MERNLPNVKCGVEDSDQGGEKRNVVEPVDFNGPRGEPDCVWPPPESTIAVDSRKRMFQSKTTRRNWFTSAGLLTSAGIAVAGAATAAEKYPRNLTKEDVDSAHRSFQL